MSGKQIAISVAVIGFMNGLLSMGPMAADATFTSIDFPDATSTDALDINSAGDIVGRYVSAADGNTHGYLRSRHGEFITIDFPGANFTVAAGIDSRGDIVGNYRLRGEGAMVRHGFLMTKDTFTTIDPHGSVFTNALGIARRGEIVGRYCTVLPCLPEKQHGFLLSGDESRRLTSAEPPGPMHGGSTIAARSSADTRAPTVSHTSIYFARGSLQP